MRTHGHREGSTIHWGLLGGTRGRNSRDREVGEGYHGEKCQIQVMGEWSQQTTLPCMYLCNNPA